MGGLVSRGGGGAASEAGGNQSIAVRSAQEVTRLMREAPPVPEMDPGLLKAIERMAEVKKKEVVNPYPQDPREVARRKAQMEKLQRDARNVPKGRVTEKELAQILGWRAEKKKPPVSELAEQIGHDDARSLARSLLLNLGTPQPMVDASNNRIGLWAIVRDPAALDTSGSHLLSSSPPDAEKPSESEKKEVGKERKKG